MLKRTLMMAALAIAVSDPGFASTKAEDCRGILNGAAVLVGIANDLNEEFTSNRDDPINKNQEELDRLRRLFRQVNNDFLGLQMKYRMIPCGETGDLEEDLGETFPELGKTFK